MVELIVMILIVVVDNSKKRNGSVEPKEWPVSFGSAPRAKMRPVDGSIRLRDITLNLREARSRRKKIRQFFGCKPMRNSREGLPKQTKRKLGASRREWLSRRKMKSFWLTCQYN